ncbi:TraB/VirB10 family protein [Nitrosophilus labii]|uniref:TraB/VirB10 family protein n=1 Tax=Nitrosophilus labii TaxID=2706014 RepID=UPI001656931B|nr:TraB/VirB10 family protein [Nitrosophilus labii]
MSGKENFFLKLFSNDKDPANAEKHQATNKILIFIGLFAILLMLLMMVGDEESKPKKDIGKFEIVNEDNTAKTRWVGEAAVDLKIAKKNVDSLIRENEKLKQELKEMKKFMLKMKQEQQKFMKGNIPQNMRPQSSNIIPFGKKGDNLYSSYPKPDDWNGTENTYGLTRLGTVPKIQKKEIIKVSKVEGALEYKKVQEPDKKEEKKDIGPENIISTGSITKVVLLSGMDAPTMTAAKTSPLPVLMKVVDMSILPNRWRFDIDECFITGEGYGDLTSERAYIRTNTLSCVTKEGKHIDMPFKGAATGEDGKLGLRGEVVTKQGALLARSLIAGFLQGVGEAFQKQNQIVLTGTTGTTTTYNDLTTTDALKMGAFSGMSKAAEKLADFYLKMADQVAPVIEISAGRVIDIINTEKVILKTVEDEMNNGQGAQK